MKKILSIILILALMTTMVACGGNNNGPDGKYVSVIAGITFASLEFNGNKVEFTTSSGTSSGTYKMEENKVIISYDKGTGDTYIYDKEKDTLDLMGMVFTKEEK